MIAISGWSLYYPSVGSTIPMVQPIMQPTRGRRFDWGGSGGGRCGQLLATARWRWVSSRETPVRPTI